MYVSEVDRIRQELEKLGAILTNDHVVLTPKPDGYYHAPGYFNKDAALKKPAVLRVLAQELARPFFGCCVDVVIGPTAGAVALAYGVAEAINYYWGDSCRVLWGYAEEATTTVFDLARYTDLLEVSAGEKDSLAFLMENIDCLPEQVREATISLRPKRVLRRGFAEMVKGKRVLVVEDVFSSGGSANGTLNVVRECGGEVIGIGVICNRSGLTAADFSVPKLKVVFDIPMVMYREDECPLCQAKLPINMQVGHGASFFARHPESAVPRKES